MEQFEEGSKDNIVVKYFQDLFSFSNLSDPNELLCGLLPRVTADMNHEMTNLATDEEIKHAAFSI